MDLNRAFEKAIKAYFKGDEVFKEFNTTAKKKVKYTKQYFDNLSEDLGIKKVEDD